MNQKKILKLVAASVAFFIIGLMLFIVNAFNGNPISAMIATKNIREYVAETYPDLDLQVPRATYNFKFSEYISYIQSPTSEDTSFTVSCRGGNIIDRYDSEVVNRFTTYRRLSSEFNNIVKDIVTNEFPYETSILYGDFYKGNMSELTLDMTLDVYNPPIPTILTIYLMTDDVSYEFLSDRLLEIHELLSRHRIPIHYITLVVEEPILEGGKPDPFGSKIHLFDFPTERITEIDLIDTLKQFIQEWEEKSENIKQNEMKY